MSYPRRDYPDDPHDDRISDERDYGDPDSRSVRSDYSVSLHDDRRNGNGRDFAVHMHRRRGAPDRDRYDDDEESATGFEIPTRRVDGGSQYSRDTDYDFEEADALREPNIIEAMKKFKGHQALQSLVYNTMHMQRRKGQDRVARYEAESGRVELVAPLEDVDAEGADPNEIRMQAVERPLKETVDDYKEAAGQKADVKLIQPEQFRELIQPLSEKRREYNNMKDQIDGLVTQTVQVTVAKVGRNFWRALGDVADTLKPFTGLLRWVDSHYGSDVHSYFLFILWIIATNFATFAVTFLFGMAPSIFWHDLNDHKPLAVVEKPDQPFIPQDIFTGQGILHDSFFHYGFYLANFSTIFGNWQFDRTMGYLFSLGFFYLFQFVVITYSITQSYGKIVSTSTMGGKPKYCDTVFFMWEHTVYDEDAIKLNRQDLLTTLREKLITAKRIEKFRRTIYIRRFFVNAFIILLTAGLGAGLWYYLEFIEINLKTNRQPETNRTIYEDLDIHQKYAIELSPAMIITLLNFVFPVIFSVLSKYEKYMTYEGELLSSLAKGICLNFGTLGTLYYYWILNESGQTIGAVNFENKKDCAAERKVSCWETSLSQKFYQLAVMNLVFEVGVSVLGLFLSPIIKLFTRKQLVFRADLLTQRIIYLQVITFLATYYSPIMCAIAILTTLLLFARDTVIIRYSKMYKSAPLGSGNEGTHAIYCTALLLSFVLCTLSVAFVITLLLPSKDCGPFRDLCPEPDIIAAAIIRFKETVPLLYEIMDILIMPPVLIFVIVFLLVLVFYFYNKNRALVELSPVLQNHLALEEKDVIALYLNIVSAQAQSGSAPKVQPARARHTRAAERFAQKNSAARSRFNPVQNSTHPSASQLVARSRV